MRLLTVLDEHTKEVHVLRPERQIGSADVIRLVQAAIAQHGAPEFIRSDNGPEFLGDELGAVVEWSRKENVVPVLTGRNIGQRKQLAADLDAFAVGEASPFRVNPPSGKKAPDVSTVANAIAGQLCQHLARHRFPVGIMERPVPE